MILRPPKREDLPVFVRWFEDMEVTRYVGHRTAFSLDQEEQWWRSSAEDKASVVWAIEYEGELVGVCAIRDINWQLGVGRTSIVIGDKGRWGTGIGTEAIELRTAYAFEEMHLHKLKTGTYLENQRSRRALERAGYRTVGIERQELFSEGTWHDVWAAEILVEDWLEFKRATEVERPAAAAGRSSESVPG